MGGNVSKTQKKVIALSFVALLSLSYFVFGIPEFLSGNRALYATTYHFFHANPFHLITNCYVLFVLFGRRFSISELILAYIVASISVLVLDVNCVGFSNILYAVMGMRTPSLKSSWWKSPNTIIFLIVTIGFLFTSKISATTHIFSFVVGVFVAYIVRWSNKLNSDYAKARGTKR